MKIEASLPKGMRDFLPAELVKRQYIIKTIKRVFELYGFQGIETPVMENIKTLTGKYGDEGDKLLFKVLNSGDFLSGTQHLLSFKDYDGLNIQNQKFFNYLISNSNDIKTLDLVFDEQIKLVKYEIDLNLSDWFKSFMVERKENVLEIANEILDFNNGNVLDMEWKLFAINRPYHFFKQFIEWLRLEKNVEFIGSIQSRNLSNEIVEKGLRYDLTVPLARYVVQNQANITFPFKRYHIAPVWRADKPQKGRYREFYQCDADVIGSKSLYNEVELMQIYSSVFKELKLHVEIKYNNRKILVGFMQAMGLEGKETAAITILDKLDKIGIEKVSKELVALGLPAVKEILFKEIIESNDINKLPDTELLINGKEEIAFIEKFNVENCSFDISLARGLDYYTGCVFEVVCNEYSIGSLGGGGRYDNLTEMFGKNELTGVGISFGLDRIYDTLEALDKFPETIGARTTVMFACFSETNQEFAFKALATLRQNGIEAEMYPDVVKFPKQMKYANDKNIPFVAIVGDNEMNENKFMLKNMVSGQQELVDINELIEAVK